MVIIVSESFTTIFSVFYMVISIRVSPKIESTFFSKTVSFLGKIVFDMHFTI